jgi:hypothetical protein
MHEAPDQRKADRIVDARRARSTVTVNARAPPESGTPGGAIEESSRPLAPEQMQRALGEAARGVVALMPDFDQLLGDLEGGG